MFACKKDKPGGSYTLPSTDTTRQVLVVCEGSLGNGNSALTLYLPNKDSVYEDVYKAANGQSLGDVFQSITPIGSNYFLCINNSDKILVINKTDWTLQSSISIPKPRYILPVSEHKAYVSSLFSNKLYTIDPVTMQTTDTIVMPYQNTEGLTLSNDGNSVLVCVWDTANNHLYSVDIATNTPTQSTTLAGYAPQEAFYDKEGKLWVLSGNVTKKKDAALTRIDPVSGNVIKTYQFPTGADVVRPVTNIAKDSIYFIEVNYTGGTQYNGVYRMNINDATLPSQAFVQATAYQYFWGLGVDPLSGNIYVADPKGFVQKGSVYIYSPDGTKTDEFKTSVGPGHIYFKI
ncbi:hypothetical protein DN068_20550 [Taibaiella soli]|uniref:YncE family protein n=1 Tax=Taibaiella soli TaxID=1649169 RepID=A0A2W2A790_9BACT|nr:hypothetical protein DN068_20550 [Taibaiella soli]